MEFEMLVLVMQRTAATLRLGDESQGCWRSTENFFDLQGLSSAVMSVASELLMRSAFLGDRGRP
jgi:hypothetical protein